MQQKQPRGTLPGPRKYAYTYEKNNDRIKLRQLLVGELEEEDVEETIYVNEMNKNWRIT